jgi:hypothetical protein
MMETDDGGELLGISLAFLLSIGFTAFLLYAVGAAENQSNLVKFFFFGLLALPVMIWKFVDTYLQNRDFYSSHPRLEGFGLVTFHSPDQTPLGKRFPELLSAKVLFAFFFAFSMFFGALVSVNAQVAVGTPELVTASVSPAASLGLSVEPAVFAETAFFNVGMMFFLVGVFYWFFTGLGVSRRASYVAGHVLAVPLSSVGFLFYHSFRYGAQEAAQSSILMQGFIYNTTVALTHSAIPAYLIHASGNFFSKASKEGIFTSETAILLAVLGAVLSLSALAVLLVRRFGGDA